MLTPGVKGLLIANVGVYLLQMFARRELEYLFGLEPRAFWADKALWQPVTYMFLHGGFTHILFNMFALWIFGGALESVWGTRRFVRFYFLTGIGAGLSNCILTPHLDVPIIGASGAVYGLLGAYGVLFPNSLLYVWGLFPIRAKYLVLIFGGFEFIASLNPHATPVAHLVHLGGMVIGVVYIKWNDIVRWGARSVKGWQRERDRAGTLKKFETQSSLRHEVDGLLDKINEVGMDNLTSWERRRLRQASEMLKQMEDGGK
jgi:membrane associated rhomboid family serine protease